jgi:chemotaxis protein CheX
VAVFFAGSWQGAVLLECCRDGALAFASRLMRINPSAVSDDDARDALGEIVNMIGGNLKSVLPHSVGLSPPSVVKGKDYAYRICGNNRRERLAFDSCAGKFCVTLLQTVPQL